MNIQFTRRCITLVFVFSLGLSHASELPSVVSFEGGGDSEGSRDSYLDLDYGFASGPRLLFSFSKSRSDSQDNPITTRSSLVGLRTDPLAPLSVGVEFEHWGEEDTLTTDTLRLAFDMNMGAWFFSLRPQWRTITFTTDCIAIILPNCNPEEEVDSKGMAIDVTYFTEGPWAFSAGYASHDYDRKVEALGQYPVFQLIFSAATLDLAAGLEDYRSSVGVSYASQDSLWSLSRLKSVAKVGGAESFVTTLRFSTDLDAQWRLRLRIGNQTFSDSSDRVGFAGAGLAYSW